MRVAPPAKTLCSHGITSAANLDILDHREPHCDGKNRHTARRDIWLGWLHSRVQPAMGISGAAAEVSLKVWCEADVRLVKVCVFRNNHRIGTPGTYRYWTAIVGHLQPL